MPGRNSRAIKGSGTTLPEFFGLPQGRPTVEIRSCARRFFLPTMAFRTILRDWRLPVLHLDDFDSFFAQPLGELWSSPFVRNQPVNTIEGSDLRNASPA